MENQIESKQRLLFDQADAAKRGAAKYAQEIGPAQNLAPAIDADAEALRLAEKY